MSEVGAMVPPSLPWCSWAPLCISPGASFEGSEFRWPLFWWPLFWWSLVWWPLVAPSHLLMSQSDD